MKRLISITTILLLVFIASWGQTVTNKQAHALLNGIVIGGIDALDKTQVHIINQYFTTDGINIKTIECSSSDKKAIDTYIASYDEKGHIIDGMLVAQKNDVNHFRSNLDNEYVWFVPKGEASVTVNSDSVLISRIYNQEMKPLGDTYLRHTEKITFIYCVQADGTFIQLEPIIESYEIEGLLSTNSDSTKTELLPTTKKLIGAEYNSLSMNVMRLLYAPISAYDKTMMEWSELGQFFKQRMLMMGVPDCDFWSANYYKLHISDILTQGDGRNMVWFYQHQNEQAPSDMMSVLLIGYDSSIPSKAGDIFDKLKKAVNRINDKAARKWWKEFTK